MPVKVDILGMMGSTEHDKMHWRCCWHPMLGKALWIGGLLSFVGGVVALWQGGEFYGVSHMTWYWTALVAGVLAAAKKSGHGCCSASCGQEGMQK